MTADRWDLLSGWLAEWREGDAAERARLRARLAVDHPDLLGEADALAAATGQLGSFLETPAIAIEAQTIAEDHAVLRSGTMIGPYRIVELLARGGMGDVYRATDVRLRRDIAMKILPQSRTGERQRFERFMHEARVTASLDQPNIVRVYDVGEDDERAYLVAELLDGETLRARIARGPVSATDVARIARDVAVGLAAAHGAGLVHRDLKPDNIVVTRNGATKILDFGIAKLRQGDPVRDGFATMTGVVLGTAGYLAPEQIRGEPVDARADLFALGAVLFEMLTSTRAFAREHTVETLHAVLHDPPAAALEDSRDVPPPLAAIVLRLLEKSPADRYQSAQELIDSLDGLAGGLAAPVARPNPSRRHRLRRRRIAVGIAAIAVAALAYGVWSYLARPSPTILAVFPFRSIPAGPDSELLESGMAEAFIARLGRLPGVIVLPLTATDRMRQMDPIEAGRTLKVTHALTGSVQREGDLVRVSVRLLSPADGATLWTFSDDTRLSSILMLQDKIVARVLTELAPHLSADARQKLAGAGTSNNDAFRAYLTGRAHVWKPTQTDLMQAARSFQEAVAIDPKYADAWAGLGSAYKRMAVVGGMANPLTQARAAADAARAIDPDQAEAISVQGTVAFWSDWDYGQAERLLRRALVLQPSSADTQVFLAHLLSNLGRHEEALEEIARARMLDRDWPVSAALEGQFLHMARNHELALRRLDDVIGREPTYWTAHYFRVWTLLAMERWDDAIAASDTLIEVRRAADPEVVRFRSAIAHKAYALARAGRRAEAETLLQELRASPHAAHLEALVVLGLGQKDEALRLLRQAVDRRDVFMTFLAVDPRWDSLRHRPAFDDLLRRTNLLDAARRLGH
jgi:TolB-like protein/tetratricopeptide (TPR) repeat protein